jgi:hypothetical protein
MHRRPPLPGQVGIAPGRHIRQKRPPQAGLPALLVRQGRPLAGGTDQHILPRRPGRQPVGPVHLVLVEQVGQTFGELEALAQVGIRRQEAAQGLVGRLAGKVRQQTHQAPHQQRLVEGRGLGHRLPPQHRPVGLPQEARGQRQIQPRGDPAAAVLHILGQGQAQPLGDAVAMHQHGLGLKGRDL